MWPGFLLSEVTADLLLWLRRRLEFVPDVSIPIVSVFISYLVSEPSGFFSFVEKFGIFQGIA